MNNQLRYLLEKGTAEKAARWLLGLVFIYASYHKIAAPGEFAKMVYGYGLFPNETINLIAIVIPFVELCVGLMLIGGIWVRSTTLIVIGMLLLFIIFISINLIRGHHFDCGCFTAGDAFSAETPWQTLVRDLLLLLAGWYVYRFKATEKINPTQ